MKTFTAQDMKDYGDYVTRTVRHHVIPDFDFWYAQRNNPTKKVIDLSVLIDSQIDCEFSAYPYFDHKQLGTLVFLPKDDTGMCTIDTKGISPEFARYCRPRMNHKHAWQGGECPIEGFVVHVWVAKDSNVLTVNTSSNSINWSSVIFVEFLEREDGYVMPWESE
jgi:hypothetical protein